MEASIKVPARVLEAITLVRDSGVTNMFDIMRVQYECLGYGYHDVVTWIDEHRGEYVEGIFKGFEKE